MNIEFKKSDTTFCYNAAGSSIEAVSIPLSVIKRELKRIRKRMEQRVKQNQGRIAEIRELE